MQECAGAAGSGAGAGCGFRRNWALRRSEWGQAPPKHVHERQKLSQNRRFVTLVYTVSMMSSQRIGMGFLFGCAQGARCLTNFYAEVGRGKTYTFWCASLGM